MRKSRAQKQVEKYHKRNGYAAPSKPTCDWERLQEMVRVLVIPEVHELGESVIEGDWHNTIRELVDIQYVILGMATEMGINLTPFVDEVHKANMAKSGGQKDPQTGKLIKPEGWKAPDIETIMNKHYGGAVEYVGKEEVRTESRRPVRVDVDRVVGDPEGQEV